MNHVWEDYLRYSVMPTVGPGKAECLQCYPFNVLLMPNILAFVNQN